MKITIIGAGYVGLTTGTCFAEFGVFVNCVDNNKEKIESLKKGLIPFYEPNLKDLMVKNVKEKRLNFTSDIKKSIKEAEVIFIAVGTPPRKDESADMQYVKSVASTIAENTNSYKVIVTKSTVPVGTAKMLKDLISKKNKKAKFDIISNPEFLREGSAIEDFMKPNRVVIGGESEKAINIIKELYNPLYLLGTPFVITNLETAELIKYAANSFLAVKISFINEIALLCEKVGADVNVVAKGMGLDNRIGSKFLHAGIGFGGSCFPKDTKALYQTALENQIDLKLVKSAIEVNRRQVEIITKKIIKSFESKKNITISILGLSFKPNTDDIRDAPSIYIIEKLLEKGIKIQATDPEAIENTKKYFQGNKNISFYKDPYECTKNTEGIILITEWNSFRNLDFNLILKNLKDKFFFDLRNVYNPKTIKDLGFRYYSVGR